MSGGLGVGDGPVHVNRFFLAIAMQATHCLSNNRWGSSD